MRCKPFLMCREEEVSLLAETLVLLQHRASSSELGAFPQPYQVGAGIRPTAAKA